MVNSEIVSLIRFSEFALFLLADFGAEPAELIAFEIDELEKPFELGDRLADLAGHFLGDETISRMARCLRTEFAKPLQTAQVHMEIPVDIVGHRHHILRLFRQFSGDGVVSFFGHFHRCVVILLHLCSGDFGRRVIAVVA